MCTFCEHYVPPDTFRATQFRDLAGLDFPFHFFFVARFSFFFFVSWKPASNVCSCVLMCRWLAPLFTYARLLVAARSYAWNSKLPFDGRTFPPLVRWSHGHMATWSSVQMFRWSAGGTNGALLAFWGVACARHFCKPYFIEFTCPQLEGSFRPCLCCNYRKLSADALSVLI